MKVGVIGDLHLTNRSPERRQDDYFQTLLDKLKQAMDIFQKEDCIYVIQVGDFFDSPTVANKVKSGVIRLLLQYLQRILCIYGQHDITGHSSATLPNSPLAVLEPADAIQIIGTWNIDDKSTPQVTVYGASFGEEIPEPDADAFNILVTHRMIGDRPLYPGQPLESPRVFLRQHPKYNLVLCGDYHYAFQDNYQGRVILNPGAIARKNLNDVKMRLQPSVAIVDLTDLSVQMYLLEVQPVEQVFDLHQKMKVTKDQAAMERLVADLRESKAIEAGWKSILVRQLEEQNVSQGVKDEIDLALEEIRNG